MYNPATWYWIVGSDATRVYSSAAVGYVAAADSKFVDWLDAGNTPTRIETEVDLQGVLADQYPAGWPAMKSTQLAPLAFIGRFTQDEQNAIATAAMGSAKLFLWFNLLTAAQEIDLASPETKAGLDALVAAGLITAARESAILTP